MDSKPRFRVCPDGEHAGMEIGSTVNRNGELHVMSSRGWVPFPKKARDLQTYAESYGWGTQVIIKSDSYDAVVILTIGRNSGSSIDGSKSDGYMFRLRWDTWESDVFKLVTKYYVAKRGTGGNWTKLSSMHTIRQIIRRNPLMTPNLGEKDG